jgi:hypothetical protein
LVTSVGAHPAGTAGTPVPLGLVAEGAVVTDGKASVLLLPLAQAPATNASASANTAGPAHAPPAVPDRSMRRP